jgi:Protein of unknown function (DUF3667)
MSDVTAAPHTCLNCAHVFVGDYCPACGQKHGPPVPSTREIFGDFMRSAFSPGGKLFESLRTLLFKPGELSRVYFAGQRKRYVHPVRVYLLCVFLFAAAGGLNNTWREWNEQKSFEIAAGEIFSRPGAAPTTTDIQEQKTSRKAGEAVGRAMKESLPAWLTDTIKARAARMKDTTSEQIQAKAVRASSSNYSLVFALLVPFMAAFNRLLYWGRGINYAGHVVFMLHGTAASCLIFMTVYIANLPLAYFPVMLLSVLWYVLAARRAFAVSWFAALWRYLVLMVPSMAMSVVVGLLIAAFVVIFA